MGVDVNLYAVGDATPEEVAAASDLFISRLRDFVWQDEENPGPVVTRDEYEGEVRWEVSTWARYYGPGYERGPWPLIYAAIRLLRAALPNCTVHYGGDTDYNSPEADDDYLAKVWEHWAGPSGDAYFDRINAFNA